MNKDNDIELKVCQKCDTPLPFSPKSMSYFNENSNICDECINFYNLDEN